MENLEEVHQALVDEAYDELQLALCRYVNELVSYALSWWSAGTGEAPVTRSALLSELKAWTVPPERRS